MWRNWRRLSLRRRTASWRVRTSSRSGPETAAVMNPPVVRRKPAGGARYRVPLHQAAKRTTATGGRRASTARPRIPAILGDPQPAGRRAEGQNLAALIDVERVAIDQIVGMALRQALCAAPRSSRRRRGCARRPARRRPGCGARPWPPGRTTRFADRADAPRRQNRISTGGSRSARASSRRHPRSGTRAL